MATWSCLTPGCGAVWPEPTTYCVHCGGSLLVPRPVEVRGQRPAWAPRQRRGPVSARELARRARPAHRVSWGYDALQLPIDTAVTIEGLPGQGKSTCATIIALTLAAQGVAVLYLASEEQRSTGPQSLYVQDTLTERLARCLAALSMREVPVGLRITDAQTPHEADEDLRGFRGVAIIDSLTDLRAQPGWIETLIAREGLGLLLVQHLTTGRQPRGGLEPAYAADVRIAMTDSMEASTVKNRWAPLATWRVDRPTTLARADAGVVVHFPGGTDGDA